MLHAEHVFLLVTLLVEGIHDDPTPHHEKALQGVDGLGHKSDYVDDIHCQMAGVVVCQHGRHPFQDGPKKHQEDVHLRDAAHNSPDGTNRSAWKE